MEDGYAICMNEWALDGEIKSELGLLLIISSLCAEKGYCYATNTFFAELFKTNEITISRKIKKLEDKNYLKIEYERNGTQITRREIRLTKMLTGHYQKKQWTINKNVKEKNTILKNNINNNINIIEGNSLNRFKKPSIDEIKKYCDERSNGIDAEQFYNFYESKGWMVGKNKMKDWMACVRTWEKRQVRQVTKIEATPDWFDKDLQINKASIDERKEMEDILNSY